MSTDRQLVPEVERLPAAEGQEHVIFKEWSQHFTDPSDGLRAIRVDMQAA